MAVLEIKIYPDKGLRKRCKEVSCVDSKVKGLLDDMVMTMRSAGGLGLAASQVGIDLRLIVIEISGNILRLINPKIISRKAYSTMEEGCLSLPNINVKIKRPSIIEVHALDCDGNARSIKAEGLLSHALQHEIDHLDGKLLIDYIPFYKKIFAKHRIKKK